MDSGAGQITRRVPGTCYRTSIGVPSRQSLAKCLSGSFMQGLCKRGPCPRADHRRGLNLGGRTVSAATTVADPIGDLAALHPHFVRGRVVGLGFCHSDLLLTPANSLRAPSPMPAFQLRRINRKEVVSLFHTPFKFSSLPVGGHFVGEKRTNTCPQFALTIYALVLCFI